MNFIYETERIYALDKSGKLIAEISFPTSEGVANITHTFVDDSLRGQGVAAALVKAAAEQIRASKLHAALTCSYAIKWFDGHPDQSDLLT